MKSLLTSRERVLLALSHKETDRVPFSLGFGVNLPAKIELQKYMGMQSIDEINNYLLSYSDLRWINPDYCGPATRNIVNTDGSTIDIWGVKRDVVTYGEGCYDEISHYPLANVQDISDFDEYLWPDASWANTSEIKRIIKEKNKDDEYAIVLGNGNIFESSWYMRGMEQMFMDLIIEPELSWEIMTRVTDYFIAYFQKVLQAADGKIDIVLTADDIGQQEGLLLSLDLWEKMIKPHHVRLNKVLHEYGVKILYHTDGAVMEAIPGLIDMGIDILEAIQFDAKGMDPIKLKDDYGDRLCFHGGISVQKTLPFGTAEEVREEVKNRVAVLGKQGGYILAPSHAIQAKTPPENILAFLKASR